MKKILFVNEFHEVAGAEQALLSILSHLDPQTYRVFVMCPTGPQAEQASALGATHIPFNFGMRKLKTGMPFKSLLRVVNPFALLWKIVEGIRLAQIVRRNRIDLLHTISLSSHIAGLVAGRLTGVPVIWHIHTFFPSVLYKLGLPNRLVFVSRNALDAAFGPVKPAGACVIYNGQDFASFDPERGLYRDLRGEFGLAPRQPVVLALSRFSPEKTVENIIDAWPHVAAGDESVRLLLVGAAFDGQESYRLGLEQRAKSLGVGDSIIFTGWRDDVADLLHTADVFVFPSENDTAGRSILEAMAMQKPVVAIRAGGPPELFVDGESGVLVEPGNTVEFASAISRLFADADLRDRLGRAARRHVLATFSLSGHMDKLLAVYAEVLKE